MARTDHLELKLDVHGWRLFRYWITTQLDRYWLVLHGLTGTDWHRMPSWHQRVRLQCACISSLTFMSVGVNWTHLCSGRRAHRARLTSASHRTVDWRACEVWQVLAGLSCERLARPWVRRCVGASVASSPRCDCLSTSTVRMEVIYWFDFCRHVAIETTELRLFRYDYRRSWFSNLVLCWYDQIDERQNRTVTKRQSTTHR